VRWQICYLGVWHRAERHYRPEGGGMTITSSPQIYAVEVVDGDPEAWLDDVLAHLQAFRRAPVPGQVAVQILEVYAVTPVSAEQGPAHAYLLH